MKKTLKKLFVPNEHNNHQPHILRKKSIGTMIAVVLLIELFFFGNVIGFPPISEFFASIYPNVIVDLTNQQRASVAKTYLTRNEVLDHAAQDKANDMANKGYFAHTSPEGITPWFWFFKEGYAFHYAGENLALNFYDSKDAIDAWMASPLHRANILDGRFTEIGIGVADGAYQGKQAVFIVQLFGTPLANAVSETTSQEPVTAAAPIPQPVASVFAPIPVAVAPQVTPASTHEVRVKETEPASPAATPVVESPAPVSVAEISQPAFAETQVAGEEITAPAASETPTPPVVEMFAPAYASVGERVAAMPHMMTSYLLMLLSVILVVALLFKILIKNHIQHPFLLANGMVMLALIIAVWFFNDNIIYFSGKVF